MNIKIILASMVSAVVGFSTQSHALISAQAMLGTDSSKFSDKNSEEGSRTLKGNALAVAVHLDPIPLVPIGFGIGLNMPNTKTTVDGVDSTLTGLKVDLEVTAWTPIALAGITPFAKLGYAPYSAYTVETTVALGGQNHNAKLPLTGSGTHLAIGATFSLIPLVSLLFQISTHTEKLKYEKITLLGQTFEYKEEVERTSTQMLIGAEVGF